jgi:deoxyribodipyrimidine photolyase
MSLTTTVSRCEPPYFTFTCKAETNAGRNLLRESRLVRRDFFIFTALKAGEDLLRAEGISGRRMEWRADPVTLRRWAGGTTGLPFVDACMRELAATGYMSNRGRQNVASLLCKVRMLRHPSIAALP